MQPCGHCAARSIGYQARSDYRAPMVKRSSHKEAGRAFARRWTRSAIVGRCLSCKVLSMACAISSNSAQPRPRAKHPVRTSAQPRGARGSADSPPSGWGGARPIRLHGEGAGACEASMGGWAYDVLRLKIRGQERRVLDADDTQTRPEKRPAFLQLPARHRADALGIVARTRPDDITVSKFVGIRAQELATAQVAMRRLTASSAEMKPSGACVVLVRWSAVATETSDVVHRMPASGRPFRVTIP